MDSNTLHEVLIGVGIAHNLLVQALPKIDEPDDELHEISERLESYYKRRLAQWNDQP